MDDKKKRIIACVEFALCDFIATMFLTVASLCAVFRDWPIVVLGIIIGVFSGYCAIKSLCRYIDLTPNDDKDERLDDE